MTAKQTPKFKIGDPVSYRGRNTTIVDVDTFADGDIDYTVRTAGGGIEGGIQEHELGDPIPVPAIEMVELKTADLIGKALDWAAAKAIGLPVFIDHQGWVRKLPDDASAWRPSWNWSQGGPLIEQHKPWLSPPTGTNEDDEPYGWDAEIYSDDGFEKIAHIIGAPTALVAVCRAVVLAKLGATVQVPKELTQ